jgi:hypothetical protein
VQTIDLRAGARNKIKRLTEALHDTGFIVNTSGLAAYHAAHECVVAQMRVGFERRFYACRKACKHFRVTVSSISDETGQFVRIHVPTKDIELILGA